MVKKRQFKPFDSVLQSQKNLSLQEFISEVQRSEGVTGFEAEIFVKGYNGAPERGLVDMVEEHVDRLERVQFGVDAGSGEPVVKGEDGV